MLRLFLPKKTSSSLFPPQLFRTHVHKQAVSVPIYTRITRSRALSALKGIAVESADRDDDGKGSHTHTHIPTPVARVNDCRATKARAEGVSAFSARAHAERGSPSSENYIAQRAPIYTQSLVDWKRGVEIIRALRESW